MKLHHVLPVLVFMALLDTAGVSAATVSECNESSTKEVMNRLFDSSKKLRPVVLTADILRLLPCKGLGSDSPLSGIDKTLDAYEIKNDVTSCMISWLTKDRHLSALKKAIDEICAGKLDCGVEVAVKKDMPKIRSKVVCPSAMSGGFRFARLLGHYGAKGHFELTGSGAGLYNRGRFSKRALEIMQDASRDPDFFEWGNPEAHAQTKNSDRSGQLLDVNGAFGKYVSWEQTQIQKVVDSCQQDVREALYWTGYAVHGIQDLVFHEGISNAEHSYWDNTDFGNDQKNKEYQGVDYQYRYKEKMTLARAATKDFLIELENLVQPKDPTCWGKMLSWSGAGAYSDEEKQKMQKIGKLPPKDFSFSAYVLYYNLATEVKSGINSGKRDLYLLSPKSKWLLENSQSKVSEVIRAIFKSAP